MPDNNVFVITIASGLKMFMKSEHEKNYSMNTTLIIKNKIFKESHMKT